MDDRWTLVTISDVTLRISDHKIHMIIFDPDEPENTLVVWEEPLGRPLTPAESKRICKYCVNRLEKELG